MHHRLSQALRLTALALAALQFPLAASAQRPPAQPNAAEILHKMQKLNVLGSVLYIVAHPDDENTKLIAWLANGKKVRTGNLSLTRGDGGQNLIGPELGDALGIIRTQELMEARRIDGGEQFFTRAVDFGFSKNAAESFEKWGKQEVLSDVVRVIRTFRPDVIITRFAPDRSAGHGHHEASAILAEEAFDLAGDPKAFPEQLEQGLEVWQPRRLFFNGSTWWKKDLADIAKNDPDWFSVDVGGYDPLLGLSYTEIAGRSRSMHKSQGFGAAETRGESLEYLKLIKGDRPPLNSSGSTDIFEGIDMTWGRVKAPSSIGIKSAELVTSFDVSRPEKSFDKIHSLKSIIASWVNENKPTHDGWRWGQIKSEALNDLASACSGVSFEALSNRSYSSTFDTIEVKVTGFPRIRRELFLSTYGWSSGVDWDRHSFGSKDTRLTDRIDTTLRVVHQTVIEPFWLERPHGNLYQTPSGHANIIPVMIPEPYVALAFNPELDTTDYEHFYASSGILHKWVDRVAGERIRPVYVTPVASVIPKTDVLIATGGTQHITVEVEALTDSLTGQLNVTLPEGWGTTKDLKLVNIAMRNERQSFTFQLMPSENAKGGPVRFEFSGPKGKADRTLHEIDYPHIMPQVYYTPAEVKLVPLDVKTTAKRVGYVKGAGDDVPQAMEQLGVTVEFVEPDAAKLEELLKYDAIVVGIRAYNSNKGMKELHPLLLRYVEQGGTLVVQYNTTPRFFSGASDFQIDPATLGPHPFTIGRGRVTVEEAPPTFLDPKHPLLNTPNTITTADFEGWVQERGLYFASDFGTNYTPLIAWNDPGEDPLNGALIVADHGKGRFIYTGISFFRQLPAGVPGAYRLFANLISPRRE
ncbi:MAG: PIG-L family deacetylase [Flavobacteriales bacterium]|nr:PIG-L family deacetylase [Flavobacteriales bacterium]